jgi:hypothetical protein
MIDNIGKRQAAALERIANSLETIIGILTAPEDSLEIHTDHKGVTPPTMIDTPASQFYDRPKKPQPFKANKVRDDDEVDPLVDDDPEETENE